MGMCASWQVPQRLLVHSCLVTLLPVATDGLKDTQLHGLLSTVWHEVAANSTSPVFQFLCCTLPSVDSALHLLLSIFRSVSSALHLLICIFCSASSSLH